MVNRVVPLDRLLDEAIAMAEKMAENPELANRLAKLAMNRALDLDMEQALQIELKDMHLDGQDLAPMTITNVVGPGAEMPFERLEGPE